MELNDTELVLLSLSGSREAFSRIVEQYQSLICSIAYSATGSLCLSEDLAQETFVIAWKELPRLREPKKLRSWLCSIARSVISQGWRRQRREPTHAAEPIDTAGETAATGLTPSERAINREEETILWRSLERIPNLYREPLVLFYREQQSVADVAKKLELTEDAVKQRLSRGRKLLTEEVAAFVEGTLARTNPGKAFTLGVLAALPLFATSARAATIGATAVKGSAAAKAAASLGIFSVLFAPVIGILAGILGTRINIDSAKSPRERQFRIRTAWVIWSLILAFNLSLFGGMAVVAPYWKIHPVLITWAIIGVSIGYGLVFMWLACWAIHCQRRIELEEAAAPHESATPNGLRRIGYEYRSRWTLFGWPLIHIRLGGETSRPVKGWVAFGKVAHGILFAAGGMAVGAVSIGGIAVGGVAFGGCAVGLLTCGGIAFGLFAAGAVALGYMVCGGAAIGWLASCGGAAAAHNFALGKFALAEHVNDETARAFVRNSTLFSHGYLFSNLSILLIGVSMIPRFLYWRKQSRLQQAGCLIVAAAVFLTTLAPQSARAGDEPGRRSFAVKITGKGQPVILIPGLSSSGAVWDGTVEHLKDRYQCHVLTLAGFAGEPRIPAPFLETVRNDLAAYIRDQKISHPIIIGHSLGGFLALWLASHDPDLPGPLVIVDSLPFLPAGSTPSATLETARPMAEMIRSSMAVARPQFVTNSVAWVRTMVTKPADFDRVMSWVKDTDPQAAGDAMFDLFSHDLRDDVARIKSPALVLGTWIAYKDYATREEVERRYRNQFAKLKNCKFVMANTRHFIMLDDPNWFCQQIDGFLTNAGNH